MKKISHIFGPVPSRRLGRSLGIDLVPFKTCSFDCVYCQLGRTTNLTSKCGNYYDPDEILDDFREKIKKDKSCAGADYITVSGSGEPTLNSSIGRIITELKKMTDIPVAVLTNGSMLWKEDVSDALLKADLVVPSLDAGTDEVFRLVNRPAEGLVFDRIIEGLENFSNRFKGTLWLEVFLLKNISDSEKEVAAIEKKLKKVRADLIQLNTVARPACENFALPVSRKKMERLLDLLPDNAEVIADFSMQEREVFRETDESEVLSLLERRPCTKEDMSVSLGIHLNKIVKLIEVLERSGSITNENKNGRSYYVSTVNS
ncbi:MAG: radical SAM protein [Spirochaetia bacterium]|jgi:wyosine [tRNA(Phe)-imidazoG37] synthetase (radical SAM superfamily)|nr:radical SAM protein [Spirochaetia bacterium]